MIEVADAFVCFFSFEIIVEELSKIDGLSLL